jgi:hypothetical protein
MAWDDQAVLNTVLERAIARDVPSGASSRALHGQKQ